jgi:hypothetical protein
LNKISIVTMKDVEGFGFDVRGGDDFKYLWNRILNSTDLHWSIIFYDYIGDDEYFTYQLAKLNQQDLQILVSEKVSAYLLKTLTQKMSFVDSLRRMQICGFHILLHRDVPIDYNIIAKQINYRDIGFLRPPDSVEIVMSNYWDTYDFVMYGECASNLVKKIISNCDRCLWLG